jgi:geranylgeranyl reductase family protein
MEVVDVLVIGAGPAGAAAAWAVAPWAETVLCDARPWPREKLCSGVLSPKTVPLVAALRPDWAAVPGLVWGRVTETWVGTEGVGAVHHHRPRPLIFARRPVLDAALVEAAQARGAQFVAGERVVAVDPEAGTVRTQTGRVWRARVIIGADGATSVVARAVTGQRPQGAVALEARIPGVGAPPRARVAYDLPGGYAWAFPKADGTLAVGVMTHDATAWPSLRAWLTTWAEAQGIAVPPGVPGHGLPTHTPPQWARGRVVLVGDAAGWADPLLGEGIPYALWTGLWAGQVAAAHIRWHVPLARVAAGYGRLLQWQAPLRALARRMAWVRRVARVLAAPGVRGVVWHGIIDRPLPAWPPVAPDGRSDLVLSGGVLYARL